MSLTFNEERHEYVFDGTRVPSVTQIIAAAGLSDYSHIPAAVLEKARQEGTAMHRLIEYDIAGDLDEDSLPEWLKPRLAAWRKFQAETGFVPDSSEKLIYHKMYEYAGTADMFGTASKLPKLKGRGVLDLKRSFAAGAAIALQLAGYQAAENSTLLKEGGGGREMMVQWRAALRLLDDGTYRFQTFEDGDAFTCFVACLTVQRWKENNSK